LNARSTDNVTDPSSLLSKLQGQYDRHRFLDVWEQCADWWTPATGLDQLSTEELVFAGRLALRLGGSRLARSLFRRVRKEDPLNPLVRYFTDYLEVPGRLLLDDLVGFEANPDIGGNNAELRANWLAAHAYTWARLRNMRRAKELIEHAHDLSPDNAWLYSMESNVLGIADDWSESLRSAERAWELDRHSLWSATSLATALLNVGEIHEACRRLETVTVDTQSAQLAQTACWYQCAITEVLEGNERAESLSKARNLALKIEPLAPLADRDFKTSLARTWLDIAELSEDHTEMERWAKELRSPFQRQVLANLKRNPNGRRVRLPYKRTLQKHIECVPTSVGSALSATGIEISIAELAADVTFGGTAEWAAADWLRNKGFYVRFFSATAATSTRLIEAGIGFMITWEDDDSGHAVAIVGVDHAAGIALAHDPMLFRTAEYLLSVFDEARGPFGVLGMAVVTQERATELDGILPAEAEVMEAFQTHQKAMVLYGPSAAQPTIKQIAERFPSHPGTLYLLAVQDLEDGRVGQALSGLRTLLERYPNSPRLRTHILSACRAIGNTTLLRQTLRTVAETGTIPGVDSQSDWVRPHHRYVAEYADLLRSSSETKQRSEHLLRSVLKTQSTSAFAWHVLADLRSDQHETESALLAYSIASFLASHNEHYAQAYVDALARSHRVEEGLRWLQQRVEQLGGSFQGTSTWITWISALEDRGFPDRAIAACEAALERHGRSTELLAFAVPFLARMGKWEEAEMQLSVLKASEGKAAFHEASVFFHRMRGQPDRALTHAESWIAEVPRSVNARYAYLGAYSMLYGHDAAATRAYEWMRAHPANEDFEYAFYQYADNRLYWRKIRLLRRRIERNPDDAWAWRELVFNALSVFEKGDQRRRKRLQPKIGAYFTELDRVDSGDAATIRAHGLWKENRTDWQGAANCYLEAIQLKPDHFYAYQRAWECSARLPDQKRREIWARMERIYLESPSNLPNPLEMMRLLSIRFGVRDTETIVTGWRLQRPDDPNVIEAAADLLLNHGHGLSDAMRALELLREAVGRFPYHSGLRFSLARACRATNDYREANRVFEELVLRRPDNNSALIQLAWIFQREGSTEKALLTLERASEQEPQAAGSFHNRAQILIESGRYDEAERVLDEALQKIPDSVSMYENAIDLFNRLGRPDKAVHAARQGTRVYPDGAYLWLLLNKALQDSPKLAAPGEIEAALCRSLKGNHSLFETADRMAIFLADQHRYQEAIDLIMEIEPRMTDPSPALGRVAWIKRHSGKPQEAVSDLAEVMRNAPWYSWGWDQLLAWLDEDENWDLSDKLLSVVPARMLTNIEFRQKRLQYLERRESHSSTVETEWEELLHDFPENVSLYLRRYDSLRKANRRAEAATLLGRVAPFAEGNAYHLARLVEVECEEQKLSAALDHALSVCFTRPEESPWPVNRVWDHMGTSALMAEFPDRFKARIQEGAQPTRRALVLYAEHVLEKKDQTRLPKWVRKTRLNPTTRRFNKLVRLVEESSWIDGDYFADLLTVLNQAGYQRSVVSLWNRMRLKNFGSNTDAWAQAGNATINLGRKRAARKLLGEWRSRTGVAMWMLGNYLLSLPRLRQDDLQEVIATCDEGLSGLSHDHCARYLAYMQAEACALSRNREGLLAVWNQRTYYFEGDIQKEEFFPQYQRYLIRDIPDAVHLVERSDDRGFRRLRRNLRLQRIWNPKTRARARLILTLLFRVVILLWLLGRSIESLIK
jgi:tetratricopeptide (TPR) repeat protein